MDWDAAIEKNREALRRVLAALVAMAGLAVGAVSASRAGGGVGTLPRHLYRAVLRLLRPAESAARRLIVVAARGLVVALPHRRKATPTILPRGLGPGIPLIKLGLANIAPFVASRRRVTSSRPLAFPLLDPLPSPFRLRRPAATGVPRIWTPGWSTPVPIVARRPPSPARPGSRDASGPASRRAGLGARRSASPGPPPGPLEGPPRQGAGTPASFTGSPRCEAVARPARRRSAYLAGLSMRSTMSWASFTGWPSGRRNVLTRPDDATVFSSSFCRAASCLRGACAVAGR